MFILFIPILRSAKAFDFILSHIPLEKYGGVAPILTSFAATPGCIFDFTSSHTKTCSDACDINNQKKQKKKHDKQKKYLQMNRKKTMTKKNFNNLRWSNL